jgi:hypothetical protein
MTESQLGDVLVVNPVILIMPAVKENRAIGVLATPTSGHLLAAFSPLDSEIPTVARRQCKPALLPRLVQAVLLALVLLLVLRGW